MSKRLLSIFYDIAVKDKQCFACCYFEVKKDGKEYCHKLKVYDPSQFTVEKNYFSGNKIESKCKSKYFTPIEKVWKIS